MNNKLILNLINDYLNDIQLFMSMFRKKYGRADILRAWHDGDIPQFGNVTDDIEYKLHGIGCCIIFPDKEVDFDFAPELRTDGFDLWRLKKYLNQRLDIKKQMSTDELERCFNQLITDKLIKKNYPNSALYFLNS